MYRQLLAAASSTTDCPVVFMTPKIELGCFICRGAAAGDVIEMVKHTDRAGHAIGGSAALVAPTKPNTDEEYECEQHRRAAWLWSQRRPIAGSVAERYLQEARGITSSLPPTLSFLPSRDQHPSAMIAAYAMPEEIESGILGHPRNVAAVHITRLVPDDSDRERGDKAEIPIGRPLGRPIALAPANDLLGMVIAEGIEDALSASEATRLGAWAAGSASFMAAFANVVPSCIESLTVLVDSNAAGRKNSNALRKRLVAGRGRIEIRLIRSAPNGPRFQ
jgi:Toprim domain